METFESLEKAMCSELETIEQKAKNGTEMSVQDLDKVDKLTHALKSLKAYENMTDTEREPWGNGNGISGRKDAYSEAYNRGFADGKRAAEEQNNMSGYYPPIRSYPERFRH